MDAYIFHAVYEMLKVNMTLTLCIDVTELLLFILSILKLIFQQMDICTTFVRINAIYYFSKIAPFYYIK